MARINSTDEKTTRTMLSPVGATAQSSPPGSAGMTRLMSSSVAR